ncbi:MAG: aspartate/glutamate racemase family protein [Bacteroidota bacterium]|nr:MAG: aspartate/glutamate racemase family protein [Bacteroidota bacterium]
MKRPEQPIGIFDSGVGGLTVAQAIAEALPNERLVYFGDTVHMPYGEKSPEHIRDYCEQIVEFLLSKHVKLIVIACNTASAIAASYLRSKYWQLVEIIGVIRPVIQQIIQDQISSVGILGTHATIGSGIYPQLIQEYGSTLDVFNLPPPSGANDRRGPDGYRGFESCFASIPEPPRIY